jgi:uncharacterized repeat protein (TIGR01451 family)
MDGAGDVSVLFTDAFSSGSGRSDLSVLVPVSLFAGKDPTTTYLYLYTQFGFAGADYQTNATFEEWQTENAVTLHGIKFNDHNADGVRNGTDLTDHTGVSGITINIYEDQFIDANNNGIQDKGEVGNGVLDGADQLIGTTTTDSNGDYTFNGIKTGETYFVQEVVPAGSNRTTGDYETVTVSGNAAVGSTIQVDPIGNHYLTPHISIDKAFVNITDGADPGPASTTIINGAGDIANYTIDVTNDGETPLVNVQVTDALADGGVVTPLTSGGHNTGDTNGNDVLDIGETWHYTAVQTATQSDLDTNGGGDGDKDNSATVTATQQGTANTVMATDSAAAPIVPSPAIAITKVFDGFSDGNNNNVGDFAGDVANYTIVVTNTGNVTLTNVQVTDPLTGNVYNVGTLAPGAHSSDLIEQYTITQADLDGGGNAGSDHDIDNTATATSDQTGQAQASAVAPLVYHPEIHLEKDATVPGGTADAAGETISYTLAVSNTGNVTLSGIQVTDPYADAGSIQAVLGADLTHNIGDTNNDGNLDLTETWQYTAEHTVTQAEIDSNGGGDGQLENTATVTSTQGASDDDDASVPVEQNPAIDVTKFVQVDTGSGYGPWEDANSVTGPQTSLTSDVHFKVELTNSGNETLTGLTLTDLLHNYSTNTDSPIDYTTVNAQVDLDNDGTPDVSWASLDTNADGKLDAPFSLAPGETIAVYYSLPFAPGQHTNTVTATDDQGVTDFDPANYFGLEECTGVRTPGFWNNKNWGKFWDGIDGNEPKQAGTPGFADGELLKVVDSNHNGSIGAGDTVGLLVGDYNNNGITDAGEDTLFISLHDAKQLIDASQKTIGNDGIQILGRDVVATWLNYLADNGIGDASDPNSPRHFLNDAIDWFQRYASDANNNSGDHQATFQYDPAVKTNTAGWQMPFNGTGGNDPIDHSASAIHSALDGYNNSGMINGVRYSCDADDPSTMFAMQHAIA